MCWCRRFFLFGVEIASAERPVLLLRGPPSCSAQGSCPRGPEAAVHEQNTSKSRASTQLRSGKLSSGFLEDSSKSLKTSVSSRTVTPPTLVRIRRQNRTIHPPRSASLCRYRSETGKRCSSKQFSDFSNSAKIAFAQQT